MAPLLPLKLSVAFRNLQKPQVPPKASAYAASMLVPPVLGMWTKSRGMIRGSVSSIVLLLLWFSSMSMLLLLVDGVAAGRGLVESGTPGGVTGGGSSSVILLRFISGRSKVAPVEVSL